MTMFQRFAACFAARPAAVRKNRLSPPSRRLRALETLESRTMAAGDLAVSPIAAPAAVSAGTSAQVSFAAGGGPVAARSPEVAVFDRRGQVVVSGSITPPPAVFMTNQAGVPEVAVYTIRNVGTADLTLGTPAVPPRFAIAAFPSRLRAGEAAVVTIRLTDYAIGTRTGVLTIPTNDADESVLRFNLRADMLTPPVYSMASRAVNCPKGEFTLTGGNGATAIKKVEIAPPNGNVAASTAYVLTVTYANGKVYRECIDGTLRNIVVYNPARPEFIDLTGRIGLIFRKV